MKNKKRFFNPLNRQQKISVVYIAFGLMAAIIRKAMEIEYSSNESALYVLPRK